MPGQGDYAAAHKVRQDAGTANPPPGKNGHLEIDFGTAVQSDPKPPRPKQQTVDDKAIIPDTGVQRYYNGHDTSLKTT